MYVKEEQGWKQLLGIINSIWVCGWLIDCHKKLWLFFESWCDLVMERVCGSSRTNKHHIVLLNDFSRWVSLPRLPLSVYQPIRVFQVSSSSYQNPLNSCSHTFHLVCLKPNGPRSCFYSADGRTFDLTHSLSAWRKQQQRYCLSSWEFLN